ncbi:MAG: glucosaminidase domain-containing protein [Hyphomicrobiaceae bacterium]|nr:glucosaminidase domain-containing protein [Hyphomicrobiaceae bacterium]
MLSRVSTSAPSSAFAKTRHRNERRAAISAMVFVASSIPALAVPPEIRLHRANRVPACATPERLMSFLVARNPSLDARHRDIAKWYRHHGERLRVRWDYAFFQMLIETNYLTFRRPDGRPGDVGPRQNNFAGIGATGGGVPGDRFPDVGTGVLAQLQHLVVYSGEPVVDPVAPRTALKQGDIIAVSRQLSRPVRFSDLARRWAADPRYGSSIESTADSFRREFCAVRDGGQGAGGEVLPWRRSSSLGGPREPGTEVKDWSATVETARGEPADARKAVPQPVAATRPHQVVRTIWQRGGTNAVPPKAAPSPMVSSLAPPQPYPASSTAREDAARSSQSPAAGTASAAVVTSPMFNKASMSGLIGGLANMAQAIDGTAIDEPGVDIDTADTNATGEEAATEPKPLGDSPLVAPKPRLALRASR